MNAVEKATPVESGPALPAAPKPCGVCHPLSLPRCRSTGTTHERKKSVMSVESHSPRPTAAFARAAHGRRCSKARPSPRSHIKIVKLNSGGTADITRMVCVLSRFARCDTRKCDVHAHALSKSPRSIVLGFLFSVLKASRAVTQGVCAVRYSDV